MIKRVLLSIMLLASAALTVSAQMSEDRIIEFITEQQEKGVPQEQIVYELNRRGVTIQQLQSMREKYEKQQSTGIMGNTLSGDKTIQSRTRNSANSTLNLIQTEDERKEATKMSEEEKLQAMYNESMFLFIDSMYLLKQSFMPLKREIYGHSIFQNKELSFEPSMNIATPKDYKLGAGDEVIIDIWGASQMTIREIISPDGSIMVENLGPVYLNGMTVTEANKHIKRVFGQIYAGLDDENKSSEINLTLGQARSIQVNVMGEVENPGTYVLSSFATIFNALYMAGGVNDLGTMRDIKLYRNNKEIASVDIYDYLHNGNLSKDIRLNDNDVIIVSPYKTMVAIEGRIRRPMLYEMKETESLQQLVEYAGGLSADAYKKDLRVIRMGELQRQIFTVPVEQLSSFLLTDGDSIYVDSIQTTFANMAEIRGAVYRPGQFQIDDNINSVKELVEIAGGIREDAFMGRALLNRTNPDKTLVNQSVDIEGLLAGNVADIELRNGDVLFIPSLFDVREVPVLQIYGEVLFPGKYQYSDNTHIEDLILQAGGLKESASISKIDVVRKKSDKNAISASDTISEIYSFSIDENLKIMANDFTLKPFDEVYVRKSPGHIDVKRVIVDGEVLFPGNYSLKTNNERLSDLIERAGLFTSEAYPEGARLERTMTEEERMRMKDLAKIISADDSLALASIDMATTFYVGIDLKRAIEKPGCDEDITLRDGDRIIVPEFTNTVKMNGEVMYSNTISYNQGKRLKYYVDKAGGYTQNAKKNKAYVIYMNGSVAKARKASSKLIQPGCEIVVPSKGERDGMTTSEILSLSSTSASLATVVIALLNLVR